MSGKIKSCVSLGLHLRTIHFSLIVIAVTLLFATVLSQPHALARALADLDVIENAAEKLRNDWVDQFSKEYLEDSGEGVVEERHIYIFVEDYQGSGDSVFHGIPEDFWTLPNLPIRGKETIGFFIDTWNRLAEPFVAEVAEDFGEFALVQDYTGFDDEFEFEEIEDIANRNYRGQVSEFNENEGVRVISLVTSEAHFRLVRYREKERLKERFGIPLSDEEWAYSTWNDDVEIEFPTTTIQVPIEGLQHSLLSGQRRNIENMLFEDAFPELHKYANALRDRNIEEVRTYLDGLVDVSEDSIELVGVGIRAGNIRRYGPLALLLAQFYLLLHLRQLVRGFREVIERSDIPWIGVYPDFLSRLSFVATVAVLPIAVVYVLLSVFDWDTYRLAVCAAVVGAATATLLAWRTAAFSR